MSFISLELEDLLQALNQLTQDKQPSWGQMSAQRMVEHLNEMIQMSMDPNHGIPLQIPADKIPLMLDFLASDKPIIQNFKASFVPEEAPLKHEEIELAVDEFIDVWLAYEDFAAENPDAIILHPYYGDLNIEQWKRMHQKHITHHFKQFGIF